MTRLSLDQALDLALNHHRAGRLAPAEQLYRQILQVQPNHPDALNLLGNLAAQAGHAKDAVDLITRAIQLQPDTPAFHNGLGIALATLARHTEAESNFRRAIQVDPTFADAHNNLAHLLAMMNRPEEGVSAANEAIRLRPDFPEAYNHLGTALQIANRLDEAEHAFQRAIELRSFDARFSANLANTRLAMGNVEGAIESYSNALRKDPNYEEAWDNLLLALHYRDHDPAEVFERHRYWGDRLAGLAASSLLFQNVRDPDRRLRIGYVSPDFREHSVAFFIEPILARHDRGRFEVFCYSNSLVNDSTTARLRSLADQWRSLVGLTDDEALKLVREDQIDLLIDLAGHTGGNRLRLFARRAAPTQITWLGYPDTTGLGAMDYRITDPIADENALQTEQAMKLSHAWCYRPPANQPAIERFPSAITFGSFNAAPKITRPIVEAWLKILTALPDSRMIVKAKQFDLLIHRQLCSFDIDEKRIEMIPTADALRDHLATYNRVTVALDPFPYNGTTTTCEALLMGVPVVTLSGKTHASRVGSSLLRAAGLEDCVTESMDDYVAAAIRIAQNPPPAELIRRKLLDSPLCDEAGFVSELEAKYVEAWRVFCAQK